MQGKSRPLDQTYGPPHLSKPQKPTQGQTTCTLKGIPNLNFTARRIAPHIAQWKEQARGAAYNQNPSTFLLNVCISTPNADIERVQAQETGTIKSQKMKRTVISRSHTQQPIQFRQTRSEGEIVHICLQGRAWPTLPLMCYRVGMERV
jgi:hypothetical protein